MADSTQIPNWIVPVCAGLFAALLILAGPSHAGRTLSENDVPVVIRASIEDQAITPVVARFVERVLDRAEATDAAAVVLGIDTPGGLLESTRDIVKDILASPVPVIVYVSPSGARAASAGVFITYAAHVAAMAPGTHIGAAHPVSLAPSPDGSRESVQPDTSAGNSAVPSAIEEKILNDTVAWIRSLAALRDRNADWAERAVRESVSITETEALRIGVVELTATVIDSLLNAADGMEVELEGGLEVHLSTRDALVETLSMWWGERLLAAIADPNIAFILLIVGFYGILFELYSPGWGVAGTLGVICLVVGFFAMAVLPVNMAGLALILMGLAMFVAEVFIVSFGALTLGGVICVVLGGLMLIDSPLGFMRLSMGLLVPFALATAAITFFLLGSVVRAHRASVQTGPESVVGKVATAVEDFQSSGSEYTGFVRIHGELWKGRSKRIVAASQDVTVIDIQGLTLVVEPRTAS